MNTKILYVVPGVIIVGLGVYYFSNYQSKEAALVSNGSQAQDQQPSAAPVSAPEASSNAQAKPVATPPAGSHFSNESDIDGGDIQVFAIDYTGTAFIPGFINVKAGDIVLFKNKSDIDFWPASVPHPAHTDYPEFDAKGSLAPGKSFQFKFIKVGSWKFHNHLNPSQGGVVNVAAQ